MRNKLLLPLVMAVCVVFTALFVVKFVSNANAPKKNETPVQTVNNAADEKNDNENKTDENKSEEASQTKPQNKDSAKEQEKKSDTPKVNKTSNGKAVAIANTKLSLSDVGNVTEKPNAKRVSFVAVGDNIVHSTVMADAKDKAQGTGKEYDFTPMFSNVADVISGADLAYINQEAPFGGPERGYSGYPMFNTPDQAGLDLMSVGFDIINLANNHMLDSGSGGYKRTVEFWQKQDATYIGGFMNKEDYNNIKVIEKDGISIALLSYTYSTNGIPLSSSSDMVIPLCDAEHTSEIDRQTKQARKLADIVVVSMHWGNEDWFEPTDLQKKQMQIMVNNGVDVILGSHPHVLEPMEWQDRPDGGRTLVIYSLGNFLSGMLYLRNMVGGIAGFDLVKVGDKAFVDNPYFIPTVCQYNTSWRKFKIYRFSEYTQELLDNHRCQRISDPGHSLQFMRNIIDKTIPQEFLIEDFYKDN